VEWRNTNEFGNSRGVADAKSPRHGSHVWRTRNNTQGHVPIRCCSVTATDGLNEEVSRTPLWLALALSMLHGGDAKTNEPASCSSMISEWGGNGALQV